MVRSDRVKVSNCEIKITSQVRSCPAPSGLIYPTSCYLQGVGLPPPNGLMLVLKRKDW